MAENGTSMLKNKVAIYVRVSTQFQVDKDSLQVQKRELAAYAEFVLGIKEYEIFEDPGYSGKDTSRPAFQRMMSKLRTGEYSHLLVWKIDRISRNLLDFATMYAELKRIGVTFVSKNEQFDTSTAIGEAMLKIILVFAELERQMTAERVTAVMLSRANNGQWNGGRVPFGYEWDSETKSFSVNEQEAAVYHRMCDLYEEKQSLLQVCEELNRTGATTKAGKPWGPVGVRKILTNVFYKGVYRYNVHSDGKGAKKREESEWIDIEDHHTALIDDVRFDRIGFLLRRNARNVPKPKDTYSRKVVHIFAGLVICGNCGSNMTATQARRRADGYRPSTYGCASRRKKTKACTNKYVTDLAIAPAFFCSVSGILRARELPAESLDAETIQSMILANNALDGVTSIEGLEKFVEAIKAGTSGIHYIPRFTSEPDSVQDEIATLKSRKKKSETALSRLQQLFLYGENAISEKDYMIERKNILDELDEINKRLSDLSAEDGEMSSSEFVEKASYFIMVDKLLSPKSIEIVKLLKILDPSVPKGFVNKITDKITVTDGRVAEILFKSGLSIRFIYS